jgi:hypothetical protein
MSKSELEGLREVELGSLSQRIAAATREVNSLNQEDNEPSPLPLPEIERNLGQSVLQDIAKVSGDKDQALNDTAEIEASVIDKSRQHPFVKKHLAQ